MMVWNMVLPLLAAIAVPAMADKDTNYYPGYYNPNVNNEMYWNDAINVLQDLDQFEALYIKYHGCVWSNFGNGAENNEIGCGYDSYGGDEYWYLGKTQCFRANVAFSLYGILADEEASNSGKASSNCNKYTYINSFFTTLGVETFAEPLGLDTSNSNSQCSSTYVGSDNDGYSDGHYTSSSSYFSVTTGCSSEGTFIMAKYGGAYCSGSNYLGALDNLSDFNDAMQSQACVKVYENGNYGSVAEQILTNSTACSVRQYPDRCPDPFGLKLEYTRTLEAASADTSPTFSERTTRILPWITAALATVGVAMFGFACFAHRNDGSVQTKDIETQHQVSAPVVEQVPVMKQNSLVSSSVLYPFNGTPGAEAEKGKQYRSGDMVEANRSSDSVEKQSAASAAVQDQTPALQDQTRPPPAAIEEDVIAEPQTTDIPAHDEAPKASTTPPTDYGSSPQDNANVSNGPTHDIISPPMVASTSQSMKTSALIDSAEAASAILAEKGMAGPRVSQESTTVAAPAHEKKKKPRLSRLFSSKKKAR